MADFNREERYLVAKRRDIDAVLSTDELSILDSLMAKVELGRLTRNKPQLQAVVIESDWPEYEKAWQMIEARTHPENSINAGDFVSAKLFAVDDYREGIYLCGDKSLFVILSKSGQTYSCCGSPSKITYKNLQGDTKNFVDLWREQYKSQS